MGRARLAQGLRRASRNGRGRGLSEDEIASCEAACVEPDYQVVSSEIDRQVMSFESTEMGRFKTGTSCDATGRLEDLPVVPYSKSAT